METELGHEQLIQSHTPFQPGAVLQGMLTRHSRKAKGTVCNHTVPDQKALPSQDFSGEPIFLILEWRKTEKALRK